MNKGHQECAPCKLEAEDQADEQDQLEEPVPGEGASLVAWPACLQESMVKWCTEAGELEEVTANLKARLQLHQLQSRCAGE